MKICCRCKKEQDISCFGKDKTVKSGLRSYCKSCTKLSREKTKQKDSILHVEWYKKNREDYLVKSKQDRQNNPEKYIKHKEQQKERSKKNKALIISHYGGACANPECGDTRIECLTIDHINNDGNERRKIHGKSHRFYSWIIKNNFPTDLQLLCWNCNLVKYHYGKYPPKRVDKMSSVPYIIPNKVFYI